MVECWKCSATNPPSFRSGEVDPLGCARRVLHNVVFQGDAAWVGGLGKSYSGTWKSVDMWHQAKNCMGRRAFRKSNKSMQPGLKHHRTHYVEVLFLDPRQSLSLAFSFSISPSIDLSIYVSVYLSIYLSIYTSAGLTTKLYWHLYIYLSIFWILLMRPPDFMWGPTCRMSPVSWSGLTLCGNSNAIERSKTKRAAFRGKNACSNPNFDLQCQQTCLLPLTCQNLGAAAVNDFILVFKCFCLIMEARKVSVSAQVPTRLLIYLFIFILFLVCFFLLLAPRLSLLSFFLPWGFSHLREGLCCYCSVVCCFHGAGWLWLLSRLRRCICATELR